MKTISRYIMTLALLLTAVTGAWAADTEVSPEGGSSNADVKGTSFTIDGTFNAGSGIKLANMQTKGIKIRTNRADNTLKIAVNDGYTINALTIYAASNDNSKTVTITGITVDGTAYSGPSYPVTLAQRNAETTTTINVTGISATDNITLSFGGTNLQGIIELHVDYTSGAWAQTQWESGDCTVTLNNGTLTVSGNGAMADYLNGSDRPWDGNSGDITSVVVESGVTSLGFNAFYFFSNLTSVTLPEGLTAIGPNAFMSCSSLQSITIPSTVTSISESAFSSCPAMTSVTLPEGLTAIGGMTFSDCSSLTSITIPSTVTSIGQGAFMSCSAITSVTLPEGLTAIGAGAFGRCSSLTSITIPSTVTSIGNYAFTLSSAISDVNLYANPDNLTWGNTSSDFKSGKATQCHVLAEHLSAYQNNFSSVNVTFVGDLQPLPTPIKVTTNAASKQDLFTEASFTMPPFDVDVNYMLVRDMQDEANPVIFSGLPSSGNIVVKKGSDGKYQPAEALTIQLIDPLAAAEAQNIIGADGITIKVLVGNGGTPIEYDQENPITLEAFLADMKPGYYWIKAEPTDENSPYDGTVYSSEFTVVEKYDLTVKPANDFSKGKIESVTVGSGSVTIDANTGEATKTGIDPETEVKIKAKRGYVIDKVEAKKAAPALKTLIVTGVANKSINYAEGDTWQQAIERPENAGSGWKVQGNYILNGALTLFTKGGGATYVYVKPGDTIDATKKYSLETD